MPENSAEKGIFTRIKNKLSRPDKRVRDAHKESLGQIASRYERMPLKGASANEITSVFAQANSEVANTTSESVIESLKVGGSSRETADLTLEVLMENAQMGYEKAQRSGSEKERIVGELNIRVAGGARARFDEIADEFPSLVAYVSNLSPEEQQKELARLEEQFQESKRKSDRTKKGDDLTHTRLFLKMLESARKLVSE